jgi:hypothetical protein
MMRQSIQDQEPGSINGYRCDQCKAVTWVVHVDAGVTPFMVGCQVEGCEGLAKSLFYPREIPDGIVIDGEWFRPATDQEAMIVCQLDCAAGVEMGKIDPGDVIQCIGQMMDHWRSGGAFMRPVGQPRAAAADTRRSASVFRREGDGQDAAEPYAAKGVGSIR